MVSFLYWALIGSFYLFLLTVEDYKKKMWVDDRKNSFMLGLTVSIVALVHLKIIYLLGIVAVTLLLQWYLKRKNVFGEADVNSITWMFLGFGFINVWNLIIFLCILSILYVLYVFCKKIIFKYSGEVPFYPILLASFILACLVGRLYF